MFFLPLNNITQASVHPGSDRWRLKMWSSLCRWFWIESQALLLMKTAQWSVGKRTVQAGLREVERGKTHEGKRSPKVDLTRTQSLFTAQIGLFKEKTVWVEWIACEVMDSFDPSHDTPRALIHPGIQSSLPHVKSDWVRVCKSIRSRTTLLPSPRDYKRCSLFYSRDDWIDIFIVLFSSILTARFRHYRS